MFNKRRFDRDTMTGTYVKRDNCYRSKQFEFDMDTLTATSYDWWLFVIRVGSTIYVNRARYSQQTDIHQDMADNILSFGDAEGQGYKIVNLYYREGLNHLDKAITNMHNEIEAIRALIANPRSRKASNDERRESIKHLEEKIRETVKLNKIISKQLVKNQDVSWAKNEARIKREADARALARMREETRRYEAIRQNVNPPEYTGLRLVK